MRPKQNGCRFADNIFKCIFLNENIWISIKISLNFVPKGSIYNIPALVQIMAWCRPGDKPLSDPMMVKLLTHIVVTWPQWVKPVHLGQYNPSFQKPYAGAMFLCFASQKQGVKRLAELPLHWAGGSTFGPLWHQDYFHLSLWFGWWCPFWKSRGRIQLLHSVPISPQQCRMALLFGIAHNNSHVINNLIYANQWWCNGNSEQKQYFWCNKLVTHIWKVVSFLWYPSWVPL